MLYRDVTNALGRRTDLADVPSDMDDWVFQNHPDLTDPRWDRSRWARRTRARWAKQTRKAVRKATRERRRREDGALMPPFRGARRTWVLILLGVAVLVGGATAFQSRDSLRGNVIATTTAAPGGTATRQAVAPLDLTQPFTNTPAAGWSDGEAGIRPPAAARVGTHSATEVAAAYARAKQILVAAHLDPRMLINHDPTAYLALFAAYARTNERKVLANPKTPDDGGGVTLLAKGFHLLPVPVKVAGTMSAGVDDKGGLVIHTNYVFAYPFVPTDPTEITQAWQIVAVQHVAESFAVVDDTREPATDRGFYGNGTHAYYDSMACQPSHHGLLAPAYSEPAAGQLGPADNPDAYYDPNHGFNVPSC